MCVAGKSNRGRRFNSLSGVIVRGSYCSSNAPISNNRERKISLGTGTIRCVWRLEVSGNMETRRVGRMETGSVGRFVDWKFRVINTLLAVQL